MLFPGRANTNAATDAVVVRPRHKAVDKAYFCANLSCLGDDLSVRQTSSFRNVWLITDPLTEERWLMHAAQPACPHCGAPLYPAVGHAASEQHAHDYAVTDYLLRSAPTAIDATNESSDDLPLM